MVRGRVDWEMAMTCIIFLNFIISQLLHIWCAFEIEIIRGEFYGTVG